MGFSTKYADSQSGLVYYGRRYYWPSLGRWLGKDPKGEIAGFNLFDFCNNGPVDKYDLLGLEIRKYPYPGKPDISKGQLTYSWALGETLPIRMLNSRSTGLKLTLFGNLSFRITYLSGLDENTVRSGASNLTVHDHEFRHVKMYSDLWNEFADEANKYEKEWCGRCLESAREVVFKMYDVMIARMDIANYQFDWDEYGSRSADPLVRGDISLKIRNGKRDLSKAEDELSRAREDCIARGCILP